MYRNGEEVGKEHFHASERDDTRDLNRANALYPEQSRIQPRVCCVYYYYEPIVS